MNKTTIILTMCMMAPIAYGQTMYRCQEIPGGPVKFQQQPCTIAGQGEAVPLKSIPAGTGSGLSAQAREYLGEREQYRAEQAAAAEVERQRQEALRVEKDKARAAEAQAAAQRETARAIWATGRRY